MKRFIEFIKEKLNIRFVRRSLRVGLVRLRMLQPIVGIESDSIEIVYGRFDSYTFDYDNPYAIVTLDGQFVNCFKIKKLTEEDLQKWAQIIA